MAIWKVEGSAIVSVWVKVNAPSMEAAERWAMSAPPSLWTPEGTVEDTVHVEWIDKENPKSWERVVEIDEDGEVISEGSRNR